MRHESENFVPRKMVTLFRAARMLYKLVPRLVCPLLFMCSVWSGAITVTARLLLACTGQGKTEEKKEIRALLRAV